MCYQTVKFSFFSQIFTRKADGENMRAVWVSIDAGARRAATRRERRADVTLCDYTCAELLQA
jgi:hypothetical protein